MVSLLLSILSLSCQDLTYNVFFLDVKMLGVAEAPDGAMGNVDPISETFTLKKIVALDDEEQEHSLLDEEKEVKIINRTLLVLHKEMPSEFEGKTFSQFKVEFSTKLSATSRFKQDAELNLESGVVAFDEAFSVGRGHGLTFVIKVKWKNTVTRNEEADPKTDELTAPQLEISFSRS